MSLYLIQGAVEEGFIYAFVALGLFISYKILNIADLTTDGSFALGCVVAAVFADQGHPYISIFAALGAGALAGLVTAFLQTKMKVPPILAGIITMTGLYSINVLILGGSPLLYFLKKPTIYSFANSIVGETYGKLVTLVILCAIVSVLLVLFFGTQLGLSIRATGDNRDMVSASSINPAFTTTIGLMLSNALIAMSGALWAHSTSQGNINIGTGTVVIGLASLILGGIFFRGARVWIGVCGAIVGAVLYRLVLAMALRGTGDPTYLKLVSAVLVAAVISYPAVKGYIAAYLHRKKEAKADAETDAD
ncbi:MAG: ABC transporter permease [Oscillospiraceae bacterium]